MDAEEISQLAGTAVLGIKITGTYVQSRFPDSRMIRLIMIPSTALSALSYAVMGNDKGTALYAGACLRSSARATPWGAKRPKLIGIFAATAVTGYATANYNEVSDLLPMAAMIIGTTGDTSSQGRKMRLLFALSLCFCATPYALIKENYTMAAAEAFSSTVTLKAIYDHDIKNAAGKKKSLIQNLKSYAYGVFKGAPTGASIKGQIKVDKKRSAEEETEEYSARLSSRDNPYFIDQDEYMSRLS